MTFGRVAVNALCYTSVLDYNELPYFRTLIPYPIGCMTAFRIGTVHLLAAILLACPYVCLSSAAAGSGGASPCGSRSGGCKCCSHPAPQGKKGGPKQPNSRPGGGVCLCHGAVVERHVEMPNPDDAAATCLPSDAMLLLGTPIGRNDGFSTERAACHFPAAESGRAVRALIASLLL